MLRPKITETDWLKMVDEAVEAVLDAAAAFPRGTPEWDALCSEPTYLRRMRDEVRSKPPGKRQTIGSRLLALSVRENLAVPAGVLDKIGTVSDVYRRWHNRPEWQSL